LVYSISLAKIPKILERSTANMPSKHSGPRWFVVVVMSLLAVADGRAWSCASPSLTRPTWNDLGGLGSIPSGGADRRERATVAPRTSPPSRSESTISRLRGGGAALGFPSGYNPFGHALTDLGTAYLSYDGSLESDVGTFLSTLKGGKRKTAATMKDQWLEIVRVSKKGQSMRIYRKLDEMIAFCLKAGFID